MFQVRGSNVNNTTERDQYQRHFRRETRVTWRLLCSLEGRWRHCQIKKQGERGKHNFWRGRESLSPRCWADHLQVHTIGRPSQEGGALLYRHHFRLHHWTLPGELGPNHRTRLEKCKLFRQDGWAGLEPSRLNHWHWSFQSHRSNTALDFTSFHVSQKE